MLLNTGVILIGRPAVRKSSAISFVQRFVADLFQNYGPTDTGGARHGIMAAMQNRWQDDRYVGDSAEAAPDSLEALAGYVNEDAVSRFDGRKSRASSLYFTSKELGRLLTAQTRELIDFFTDGLDGEPIYYQTKTGSIRIPKPVINLLGATTPGSLASLLPRDSHDHGFLSRTIFVYSPKGASSVPIPPAFTEQEENLKHDLLERLRRISTDAAGDIPFDSGARAEYTHIYNYAVPTLEFKLNAYSGRRSTHLAKLAGIICLLRAETPYVVTQQDVALAHIILSLTEESMDGAYMGLDRSKDAQAYRVIREVIESQPHPERGEERGVLYAHLSRDGLDDDSITASVERLVRSKRLEHHGSKITLPGSIVGEKLALYVSKLGARL